jgi:hypothetical protein
MNYIKKILNSETVLYTFISLVISAYIAQIIYMGFSNKRITIGERVQTLQEKVKTIEEKVKILEDTKNTKCNHVQFM